MKERPILFSGAMVRAILEGRKTQTRRVAKQFWHGSIRRMLDDGHTYCDEAGSGPVDQHNPYGIPGDRLWVRETFLLEDDREYFGDAEFAPPQDGRPIQHHARVNEYDREHDLIPRYRATESDFALECEHGDCNEALGPCMHPWRPSIFMPRWASRITLEITDVRVQRLQEISCADAIAEGIRPAANSMTIDCDTKSPRDGFRSLWDSINAKKHPWSSNPWIWALTFRRLA